MPKSRLWLDVKLCKTDYPHDPRIGTDDMFLYIFFEGKPSPKSVLIPSTVSQYRVQCAILVTHITLIGVRSLSTRAVKRVRACSHAAFYGFIPGSKSGAAVVFSVWAVQSGYLGVESEDERGSVRTGRYRFEREVTPSRVCKSCAERFPLRRMRRG